MTTSKHEDAAIAEAQAMSSFCRGRRCGLCLAGTPGLQPEPWGSEPSDSPAKRHVRQELWPHSFGIAIVSADPDVRKGMDLIFSRTGEFHSSGFFSSAEEALRALPKIEVHLLLVEVELPAACGIKSAMEIVRCKPHVRTILLTSFLNPLLVRHASAAGIKECLIRPFNVDQGLATLYFAACQVDRGPRLMGPCSGPSISASGRLMQPVRLRERKEAVLGCLAEGLLYKEIEARLHISRAALKKLQHRIFMKLGAHNRTEAVMRWSETRRREA